MHIPKDVCKIEYTGNTSIVSLMHIDTQKVLLGNTSDGIDSIAQH